MDDTSSASGGGDGFFGTVNSVLGAVNNFGTTALSLRERARGAPRPSSTAYAVPVAQGSQPGQVAAVNEGLAEGRSGPTIPQLLVSAGVLVLVVVIAIKLRG